MKNLEWVKGKRYTKSEAWELADRMFPTDYLKDDVASERAGYPIYMSTLKDSMDRICDLGIRLEVNIGNKSFNIWFIDENTVRNRLAAKTKELYN